MAAQVIIDRPVIRIARKEIPRSTVPPARWLLGKVLVGRVRGAQISGRIAETGAYLQLAPRTLNAWRDDPRDAPRL